MNDFMNRDTDFEIPAGCEACPVQCSIAADLDDIMLVKREEVDLAGQLVGEDGQQFDEMLHEISLGNDEFVELYGGLVRKIASNQLDMVDHAVESLQDKSRMYANSCDKPLKMRAAKSGKVYEVHLCTSALEYYVGADEPRHTESHTWVQTPRSDD